MIHTSFFKQVVFVGFLSTSMMAAEKLGLSTHDSLIQKLESVVSTKGSDSMYKQSQLALRLADLYAERARLLSLEQEGKGDIIFKDKISTDRAQAIKIYSIVQKALTPQEKGRVLLQSAHLHIMMQKQDEAEKIYSAILKSPKSYSPETVAVAHIQMGDIMFYKGDFEKSYKLFRGAIVIKENPRKGYALYRAAWCQYNVGKTRLAQAQLIVLLKNKPLFVKVKTQTVDVSFQEEVSRDLATFMARNGIAEDDIHTLAKLSPDSSRQKNLVYLATELDRTAKKQSALLVWNIIGTQNIDFESQLEGQIQITRIQYDLGHKDKLLVEIDRSITLLKRPECAKNDECVVAQQNLKKIITEWGKAEERAPSTALILGFAKYTSNFDDAEMSYWAGHSSLKSKLYPEAYNAFKKAAQLFSTMDRSSDARLARMFEGSLLGAIEAAESSENNGTKLASYKLYLELNPKGSKRDDIKYQIAHLYYEINAYAQASTLFRELAIDDNAPASLREKSSELCLDSSVILKNEPQIEADSLLFAQTFKHRSAYFVGLWRKSILNQSAKVTNAKDSSDEALSAQWTKLDKISLSNWPPQQKKTLLRNKLAIGIRLKNLDMVSKPSDQFLALDNLTNEEDNWALDHAAWVAEMRMDFPKALKLLKQVTPKKSQLADHYFKLALLMELAHQDPTAEYNKFMAISKDNEKRQYAAFQLVKYSSTPKQMFVKYAKLLKSNSPLYASAGVIAYEKSQDYSVAKAVLSNRPSSSTFESQILARSMEIKEFEKLERKLWATPLTGRSDKTVQKNLVARIKLIKQLEKKSQMAIQKKDSSLQLIYLSQVAFENSKLVKDIMALPIPKQLTAAQKKYYQEQMQLQVKPYITQAITVKEKVSELWDSAIRQSVFKDLHDLSEESDKPGSLLARAEILKLTKAATLAGITENPFINFTRERHKVATEASELRKSISEDPFNSKDIEKYKSLQKRLGNGPMVAYLESRSRTLQIGLNSQGDRN